MADWGISPDPADLLAEFGEFVEPVGGVSAAPDAQEFPAGTEVLVIDLNAAFGFDVEVIVAPVTWVPAAVDWLVPGLAFFPCHVFQNRHGLWLAAVVRISSVSSTGQSACHSP